MMFTPIKVLCSTTTVEEFSPKIIDNITLFVPNAPFLYPLKTSEKLTVFWCFQLVEKRYIGNEWIRQIQAT